MARLGLSEHRASAADLQILLRDPNAAAQFRELAYGLQPLLCLFIRQAVFAVHDESVCLAARTPDAAAELIELRQPVALRVVDDNGIDVRNVYSGLNDGGRNEHVRLAVDQRQHAVFDLGLLHPAVDVVHVDLREHFLDLRGNVRNVLRPVVHIIYLAAALHFPEDRFADDLRLVLHDVGLYGFAVLRGLRKKTHVPDADHGHMEGSGNGRRGQGQRVHIFPKLFDLLFMADAETLLLINDQKPKVFIAHVFRQELVCADHDVHRPVFEPGNGLADLGGRGEA